MGFWSALEEEFPQTQQQRCWVHKTANVLDKMPKSIQGNAKKMLHEIYLAPSKKLAMNAYDAFLKLYEKKYEKACKCLEKSKNLYQNFWLFRRTPFTLSPKSYRNGYLGVRTRYGDEIRIILKLRTCTFTSTT